MEKKALLFISYEFPRDTEIDETRIVIFRITFHRTSLRIKLNVK